LITRKMSTHLLFMRFIRYYKRNGIIGTAHRFLQKIGRLFFPKSDVLFFVDLPGLQNEQFVLPDEFSIDCIKSQAEISKQDLDVLFENIGEKIFIHQIEERFDEGALLWLVKVNGILAGHIWSIQAKTIQPHFLPLTDKDVHLFDDFIFEEFRGRGVNPVLIDYMLGQLKKENMTRTFIETNLTNESEIRSLAKTSFKRFGLARKYHAFGRCFVVWSKLK
jgi:GNAT superfamily N-acetyltransferase